jgi:hypothetical protein
VAKAIAAETLAALPKLDRAAVDPSPSEWSRSEQATSESSRSAGPSPGLEPRPSERPTSLHSRRDLRQGVGSAHAPTPVSMSAVAPPRAAAPMGKLVLGLSLAGAALIAAALVAVGGVGMVMIVQGRTGLSWGDPTEGQGLTPVAPLTEAGGAPPSGEPRSAAPEPGPQPTPRKVRPQDPPPAGDAGGGPAPAPAGPSSPSQPARVSFSGVDRLWLVRLDDPDAPPPDLAAVPPGRYRVFAEFPNVSGSSGAGEIDVRAGRRVHLTCVADFARCKPE